MGDVTEQRMRHYVGADADKATIPVGGKSPGDSYHGNDSKKQYYWNGTDWKTGLGYEYVPRAVVAPDKQVGDFTTDGAWHENLLDLSGIVPAGAVAVALRIKVEDDAADSYFSIRQNGTTHTENRAYVRTQVASIRTEQAVIMNIDANRLLDYSGSNLAFTIIDVYVLGWFI